MAHREKRHEIVMRNACVTLYTNGMFGAIKNLFSWTWESVGNLVNNSWSFAKWGAIAGAAVGAGMGFADYGLTTQGLKIALGQGMMFGGAGALGGAGVGAAFGAVQSLVSGGKALSQNVPQSSHVSAEPGRAPTPHAELPSPSHTPNAASPTSRSR